MNVDPALLQEVGQALAQRLTHHADDVVVTLQRVARGQLELVETITPAEAAELRALCGSVSRGNVAANLTAQLQQLRTGEVSPRLAVLLISYVFYDVFHFPQEQTGRYDIAGSALEKLRWLYRYWFNQLEVAECASGLESFFAAQSLVLPDDDATERITVSCAGDLLAVDLLTPESTRHLFDAIGEFYSTADLVTANLESTADASRPVGRTQEPGYPARMNTSEAMLRRFAQDAGINFVSTATNHALDWGQEGVHATLDALDAAGISHAGTARSATERDTVRLVEKNGVRLALLGYTFDLNGHATPPGQKYLVNEVRFNDPEPDLSLVERDVAAARAAGADHVIAFCHWGWEFEHYPHLATVEVAHRLVAAGVDTVLGNHAHVSQPAQLVERPQRAPALVVYGLGEFVSYHPASRNSALTYALRFDVVKDAAGTRVTRIESLPLYLVHRALPDGGVDSRIVPFRAVLAAPAQFGLTDAEQAQLPHLRDAVWGRVLAPLAGVERRYLAA